MKKQNHNIQKLVTVEFKWSSPKLNVTKDFNYKMSADSSPWKSYQEKLEWFFGPGIPHLDPSRVPVESDIVKLCIHTFDNLSDSGEKSPDKNEVIKEVTDILIDYFKKNDPNAVLKPERTIIQWIERLFLERAKKYEFRLHKAKKHVNDKVWIAQEKSLKGFDKIVNITKGSGFTPSPSPMSPKRKMFFNEDNTDQVKRQEYIRICQL